VKRIVLTPRTAITTWGEAAPLCFLCFELCGHAGCGEYPPGISGHVTTELDAAGTLHFSMDLTSPKLKQLASSLFSAQTRTAKRST